MLLFRHGGLTQGLAHVDTPQELKARIVLLHRIVKYYGGYDGERVGMVVVSTCS